MDPVEMTGSMREGEVERVRRSTWAWENTRSLRSPCSVPSIRVSTIVGFNPSNGKKYMKVATFALERWMSRWETEVEYDIAESGIVLESDHHGAENILRDLSRQGAPPAPSPDPKLTGE